MTCCTLQKNSTSGHAYCTGRQGREAGWICTISVHPYIHWQYSIVYVLLIAITHPANSLLTDLRAVLSEHEAALALLCLLLGSVQEVEVVDVAPCVLNVLLTGCVA